MRKKLLPKTLFIIAVLLVFVYGIFLGTEPDKAIAAWKQQGPLGAIQQNIHLGLDLKGGTHLILQVAVNEAVNAETDRVAQSLREDLGKAGVTFTDISKPDPQNRPETITVSGVPPDKVGALRNTVSDTLQRYDLSSGSGNAYQIVMKPSELTSLKQRAVQQAIDTIRNRVDQLGVSEPVIQEHGLGDYQILVQLPGVDDPARVKEVMQSTAMLEIRQSLGGPYASQAEAMQAHGGVLPPDAVLMPGRSIGGRNTDQNGEAWDLISRTAAVSGRGLRA